MTSPLATRRRAEAAHQANAVLQCRLAIVAGTALFIVLLIMAIGHGFAKMDAYETANQEVTSWTLK